MLDPFKTRRRTRKKKAKKKVKRKAPAKKAAKKAKRKPRRRKQTTTPRSGYANFSGPAVEDREILEKFEPYWAKIQAAAARALRRSAKGFLPAIDDSSKLLGCGAWGCVYQTKDKRFALKISLDATEGPVISKIIHRRALRLNPGVVYYRAIWQLPELFYGPWGNTQAWVILREEVDQVEWKSRGKFKKDLKPTLNVLQKLPETAGHLIDANEQVAYCPRDPDCLDYEKRMEKAWVDLLKKLKGPAAYVGDFLIDAYKQGLFIGDVHEGNVGLRCHDLSQFGVPRHRKLVVTDVGDQDQPILTEDKYPKVKVMRNPSELAYWAQRIPVL